MKLSTRAPIPNERCREQWRKVKKTVFVLLFEK
jgi:hypothetical protein